ncbi:zeta toxin family protein [Streptomyces sp. NPDC059982]|uniref:zeta toxin family protein n=1 Tax=unclassified Streptomyces TaxID=2593676 RepID=UPI00368B9321
MNQAEAYVRARRGDVLIEAAPASGEEFLASALPSHEAGYPIEVIVVAVRAADSRQATALRYARAQQIGTPARFTSAAGHDTCFDALPEVVATAASHPAVSAVTVMRRDGTALFRSEVDDRRAVGALDAERERPYTEQEAPWSAMAPLPYLRSGGEVNAQETRSTSESTCGRSASRHSAAGPARSANSPSRPRPPSSPGQPPETAQSTVTHVTCNDPLRADTNQRGPATVRGNL